MVFDISETDHNARRQNQVTMATANVIKWRRIQLTNDEAGIENREKFFLGGAAWRPTKKIKRCVVKRT